MAEYHCPVVSNANTAGSIFIHYLIIAGAAKQREQWHIKNNRNISINSDRKGQNEPNSK